MSDWRSHIEKWTAAGLIDAATAARVRDYEAEHGAPATRWPVVVAIVFGCVMVGAGVLLFVAAHWDQISPGARFTLVLAMVAFFHLAGAYFATKHDLLATGLHGVGTASLGAGIFLTGQIFHLEEHWPGGIMLWAIGAIIGYWLLRDPLQGALSAILVPAWLAGEWHVRVVDVHHRGMSIEAGFILMTAIVYFGAVHGSHNSGFRRALMWIGGLAFIPAVIALTFAAEQEALPLQWWWSGRHIVPIGIALRTVGWLMAIGLPFAFAWTLRRKDALVHIGSALWIAGLVWIGHWQDPDRSPLFYLWCLVGAIAMIAWGVRESRKERVNLGMASFALTVIGFYFSSVLDKFGRSTALISMGLLFLLGGWVLEKTRRRLIARISEADGGVA